MFNGVIDYIRVKFGHECPADIVETENLDNRGRINRI